MYIQSTRTVIDPSSPGATVGSIRIANYRDVLDLELDSSKRSKYTVLEPLARSTCRYELVIDLRHCSYSVLHGCITAVVYYSVEGRRYTQCTYGCISILLQCTYGCICILVYLWLYLYTTAYVEDRSYM